MHKEASERRQTIMKNKNYQLYYKMQDVLDGLYTKSKNGQNLNQLMKIVTSRDNILLAYRNLKGNNGSGTPGIDGKTINDYKELTEDQLVSEIQDALMDYTPAPIKRVLIPKKNGKQRPLGIPTIRDRIIQQAILQILEPICEARFYQHSYGFRPNRSTQHAIARMSTLINISQTTYVVDMDIKGFFDNVNHKILRQQIWNMGIHDKQLLAVISKMLKAPIDGEGIPTKGTPQGSILSPLLANIVLNDLDWWVSNQWENFKTEKTYSRNDAKYVWLRKNSNLKEGFIVRYADDFKILCPDYNTAKKWFYATEKWLKKNLDLDISPEKSKVTDLKTSHSDFLGFSFRAVLKGGHEGRDKGKKKYFCITDITDENIEEIVKSIKTKVKSIQKRGTRKAVWDLNVYIIGVHEYFQKATNVSKNFSIVHFRTMQVMFNRFKRLAQADKKPCCACHFTKPQYNGSNSLTYLIGGLPIVPIRYVQFSRPQLFTQDICDYTVQGREKNKTKLLDSNIKACVQYLSEHFIPNRSVEYNDNRISIFSAHKGKCYITGKDLTVDIRDYHCHHKIPREQGGDDSYNNLCPLCIEAHKLVHASDPETIKKYIHIIKDNKQLERLNNLRKLCGLNKVEL